MDGRDQIGTVPLLPVLWCDSRGAMTFADLPLVVRTDVEPSRIYFLPNGVSEKNLQTGHTVELWPGYWVNPKQLGMVTGVRFGEDA